MVAVANGFFGDQNLHMFIIHRKSRRSMLSDVISRDRRLEATAAGLPMAQTTSHGDLTDL